ncbi:MAG: hypothetical protein A3G20_05590 [Acidobacteria bacterium RIFCSPLOWO2_12_FULL_59_11]|nr:MAG: hypothetical protein A3G20_05590 [Acidobacteria bacterium RIFCSPLOWO2_12_FULL_59_11]
MRHSEKISYIMLFCGLMLVRNSKMQLKDLALLFPYHGKARFLVQELAGMTPTETGNAFVSGVRRTALQF